MSRKSGIMASRRRGYNLSSGEYVCFIDSDDKIAPQRFEKQLNVLEQVPTVGLVYSDASIINETSEIIGKYSVFINLFGKMLQNPFL